MCDDYEDIERIVPAIEDARKCGVSLSHKEVLDILRELIELGYARAWDFEPRKPAPPEEYPGMPPLEEITAGACFKGTPQGLEFYESRSLPPPFYWNGKLHKDWVPPNGPFPRGELIRVLVLASIWDYYTVVEFIQMRMDDLALRLGTSFSRDEIMSALCDLIEVGYAKAWRIDRGDPAREYEGMPPVEDILPYKAYFYITPEGMDFHLSNDTWWPFDDDDNLRPDWTPPTS